MTSGEIAAHLHQRPRAAARRRSAGGRVAKAVDDPRNPLAVEVLARDHDDAAVAEVVEAGEDAAVPEGEDRLAAATG